jgi:hypothetical protein
MTRQTSELPNGYDLNSISFDEFVKYLTGYSSYEQLADEMNKGYDHSKGKENHGRPSRTTMTPADRPLPGRQGDMDRVPQLLTLPHYLLGVDEG